MEHLIGAFNVFDVYKVWMDCTFLSDKSHFK